MIYRVPSFDDLGLLNGLPPVGGGNYFGYNPNKSPMFLMNLGSRPGGVGEPSSYTYSDPSIDLAVISLNSLQAKIAKFAERLLSKGHIPITLDDFVKEPAFEGAEVFIVGYPMATSKLGPLELEHVHEFWRSTIYSLPTFSFGKVSMQHEKLHYIKFDISAYPGSSGAPVVANRKLIGIVSKQAYTLINIISPKNGKKKRLIGLSRIPFTIATKAKYIIEILEIQVKKDNIKK